MKVTSDSPLSQPLSAYTSDLRKGLKTETRPCEENTSSVHVIDTNGGGDEDSDFDLPTFDLIGPFIRGKIRRVLNKTRTVPFIRACLI